MNERIEKLRKKGVVLTIQRLAVWEFLENSCGHPTVEEIYKGLKKKYPSISQATVYSTLELLRSVGEIQELSIRKNKVCFDPNPDMHHHFLCRRCENVSDIIVNCPEDCPIIKQGRIKGHRIEGIQAYLYGICANCLKEKKKARKKEKKNV